MLETQPHPKSTNGAPIRRDQESAGGEVSAGGTDDAHRPRDRSHLLRRTTRTVYFIDENEERDGIRIRRERRVNASFSGIPSLARNGRH